MCPSCGASLAPGSTTCGSCGAPVTGDRPATRGAAGGFDLSRLGALDRTRGIATIVMLIGLFLPWYGAYVAFVSVHVSGIGTHGWLYLVFFVGLAILAELAYKARGGPLPVTLPWPRDVALFAASTFNLVLVLIAFVAKPSGDGYISVGWSWGAVVSLIAAFVADSNAFRTRGRRLR